MHLLEEEEAQKAKDAAEGKPKQPTADESIVTALEPMGFTRVACRRAALATNNKGSEAAMEWLFTHESDPDINSVMKVAM